MEKYLSDQEKIELRTRHRSERDRRVADRIKAILLSDEGWSYRQIGKALLLDEETIKKHVEEYRSKHQLKPLNGGSKSQLSVEETELLLEHLEKMTYPSVKEICAHVKDTFMVEYTISGMTAWLHRNGFVYKKPKSTPAKADPVKQAAFIEKYEKLRDQTPENEPILFIDSVHPTMETKLSYGWIKKGKEKLIEASASRTRMNITGALELKEMKIFTQSAETINTESLIDFLNGLKKNYVSAPRIHIILDQAGYHTSALLQSFAENNGFVFHYLPPYSPNLNPIERVWKVTNEKVRNNRYFFSAKQFRQTISTFLETELQPIIKNMADRINDNFQIVKSASSF